MRMLVRIMNTELGTTTAALLRTQGYARLTRADTCAVTQAHASELDVLNTFWDDLPPDPHLKDGGRYRYRRHASYVQTFRPDALVLQAPRAHWQPLDYNALHGGIERWFAPISPTLGESAAWCALIAGFGALFARAQPVREWFVEAHPFRIDTKDGVGRPTPEGAHRDGVDFVVVLLVQRQRVKGGETRVFEAHGPQGVRFTMEEPWSALLLDDAKVIHETTPIQPLREAPGGVRDTLVLTYRAGGFQDPAPHA